jgi:hypothetical protein
MRRRADRAHVGCLPSCAPSRLWISPKAGDPAPPRPDRERCRQQRSPDVGVAECFPRTGLPVALLAARGRLGQLACRPRISTKGRPERFGRMQSVPGERLRMPAQRQQSEVAQGYMLSQQLPWRPTSKRGVSLFISRIREQARFARVQSHPLAGITWARREGIELASAWRVSMPIENGTLLPIEYGTGWGLSPGVRSAPPGSGPVDGSRRPAGAGGPSRGAAGGGSYSPGY